MTRASLAALALVALAACGPARRHHAPACAPVSCLPGFVPGTIAYETSFAGVRLWIPPALQDARSVALLVDAASRHVAAFSAEVAALPPTDILVTDAVCEWEGQSCNGHYPGLEFPQFERVVIVWQGYDCDLHALFHELVHRTLHISHRYPVDDPRWTTWDAEDAAVALPLEAR